MAEPLAVDPARLIAAGSKLAELVLPTAPPPIAATGSDSVSAAINETMPGIESLVSDGLPGVTAALKRTATAMSTAADIYTKADQSLGESLRQYEFVSDGQAVAAGGTEGVTGAAAQLLGAPAGAASQIGQAVSAQADALAPRVVATVPQVVQLAPQATQMAQQASPIAQTISQSAQQGASSASQGGVAAPAQLASDAKPAGQAQLVDETKKDDTEGDEQAEGATRDEAAAGEATLVSAPIQGATRGDLSASSRATPI
ncbi:hypothetical protein [Mycobacterium lacus]|uniref:ESX-1 secretion-associated protein EspJ n=1 Tax=Mycobacterium lacus TaxID=169765 RepID=A0A1X1XNP7_9MYCO|nr:hypothetical protein [Mycobacterium lacus]MCV7124844.1 hypothetical protein [Mycobacterium lacus]ORW00476.1 hypothetical protein AWC15_08325 [Mycobacterium lacus]BBX99056.1 ESX-1 secretion-associated protein EspJ [Mycobacterium lacus]